MILSNPKKAVLLPLGFVKHMPIKFQQSFYQHVADITAVVEDEQLADPVAVFRDLVTEVLDSVHRSAINTSEEMYDLYDQADHFWQGTRHLFKAYRHSTNAKDATLANKALDMFQRMNCKRLLLSNAGAKLAALASNISAAWKPTDLTGTFLEGWVTQLNALATNYADALQKHVERGAQHVCFTERKMDLYESFEFLYLNFYTYMGNTGDLAIAQVFSDINDLIAWYTATAKAHATRVKNANENGNENGNENVNGNANENGNENDNEEENLSAEEEVKVNVDVNVDKEAE